MKNDISVFMIVKNEAANLPACLDHIKDFVKEIIVVDGFSSDDTLPIAQKYGCKTFQREMESFTIQKQFALDQCQTKWVFNIDADEIVPPAVWKEIYAAIKNTDIALFEVNFRNIFLGKAMKFSGLASEYKNRLALRSKARYEGGKVHEVLVADGKKGQIKTPVMHTPYRDIEHYFNKLNAYTSLGAASMYEKGKKFRILNLLRQPFDFFKIYIIKLAVLDGIQGFLWALFSSFYPVIKYAKLWNIYRVKGGSK